MYVLTVTNFGDTCSGRSDTVSVSVYDSYQAARAAAGGAAAVDDLTVDTRHWSRAGADVTAAKGVFVDGDGVALFGFRITHES
ncbi:hypothetical protein BST25_05540 [Mycobacterium heidelbergense]|uniref:Uncharacterized protein n=2 Tax=Mycobacterium heidelbergense TaxID=53376 RepID=A0A1X0DSL2_MYCHE|nr:hypothetical protein BST25_05540 [Mycobacterium heidelbergense]BBZ50199.1 hypothetical protein MHEI_19160 [Mycobacterium heidelbergense]